MRRYLGWEEASDNIHKGIAGAITSKTITYDLARARAGMSVKSSIKLTSVSDVEKHMKELVPGATLVTTSGFGDAIISNM